MHSLQKCIFGLYMSLFDKNYLELSFFFVFLQNLGEYLVFQEYFLDPLIDSRFRSIYPLLIDILCYSPISHAASQLNKAS
jgi:hypothetical protein